MKLFVGLGNPGSGMSRNRHNIGFMAVDEIARRHGCGPWRQRFKGEVCEAIIAREKILLLKPQTFMNLSGDSVQQAAHFYKILTENILVFHDELDISFGKMKIKCGGGAAGHNGLRSMDRALSSQNYWRVRLGIGHPGSKERVASYVLSDFSSTEQPVLENWLCDVADNASLLVEEAYDAFMSKIVTLSP